MSNTIVDGRTSLLALALKHGNDWNRMYEDIQSHKDIEDVFIEEAKNFTGNFITFLDKEYPSRLKNKYKPPLVLYYDGDISLLKRADENGGKNHLIFLHGPNIFNIPGDNLCVLTADNKLSICNDRLRVWFNNESTNIDRYGLAAGICYSIVGTKVYPLNSRSWFLGITVGNALALGADVYMVPTAGPSANNNLIKEGCNLIDCLADLERGADVYE